MCFRQRLANKNEDVVNHPITQGSECPFPSPSPLSKSCTSPRAASWLPQYAGPLQSGVHAALMPDAAPSDVDAVDMCSWVQVQHCVSESEMHHAPPPMGTPMDHPAHTPQHCTTPHPFATHQHASVSLGMIAGTDCEGGVWGTDSRD